MDRLWYALHVRSRFEKLVLTQLEGKGYEAFLPMYTSVRRWSDRTKSASLPLFPNYIFCRFDVHSRLPILVTQGVNFVVGAGKTPIPVDDQEIAALRYVLAANVTPQPWPYIGAGEVVRVIQGPLKGVTGIVLRTKGCDRLILSISLLMRSVAMEIDRRHIEPLPEALNARRGNGSFADHPRTA
jgi:transcription antitermination factor NusG